MRIISPVDNLHETALLLEAGADELYGGYLPDEWGDYSHAASLNQRTFPAAQIATEEELKAVVNLVHERGKTFALTLNAPFYTEAQMPMLTAYIDRMVAVGIDSLILADVGVLRLLKKRHPMIEYHASTLAHLSNAGSAAFMAEQGMQRVVLPRHLTVADMAAVIQKAPEIHFDAFLLVGKCPNTEGLCTFHHSSPDKIWPCEIPYQIEPLGNRASENLLSVMKRQKSWSETNRRHGCGLCAIPFLQKAGVKGLKLVGRGAPAAQKVSNVRLAKEFLFLAGESADFADYRRKAMAAHKQRFGAACHQNVCYYPEFLHGGAV